MIPWGGGNASHPCYTLISRNPPMQLTSKSGHLTVDFYQVQYANGDISERIALKVVTLMGETQSKRYIRIKDVKREVWSRIHNYGYKQTRINTVPQLFNGALAPAC